MADIPAPHPSGDTDVAEIRHLLARQPLAALATLHRGDPAVSMVPVAWLPDGRGAVIHVSRLATHTADLLAHPAVALLVTGAPGDAATPLATPRVSVQGTARPCAPDDPAYAEARATYLARLPDAAELFEFGDFTLVLVEPRALRWVAGFGRATSLAGERLRAALSPDRPATP